MRVRWTAASVTTVATLAAAAVVFAALAWHRRWLCDDGLIFVRVARQILAGNGPVFNDFERAESTTSVLWTWLLAGVGAFGARLAPAAVVTSWVLAVTGVGLALDACRRWQRSRGLTAPIVPFLAVIVIGGFPFRDFATSGLETGLITCWLGGIWWLLVALGPSTSRRRLLATAVAFGLGPLVRPDLAIASIGFLVAGWTLVRPPRRRTILALACALAIPFVYELFRAGYYGTLVPLPALAKSAAAAEWQRGAAYVAAAIMLCWLWVPLGLAAIVLGRALVRRTLATRDQILVATPIACGALMLAFVIRVGGDFMFARMALPPLFMIALPGFALPLSRRSAVVIAPALVWMVVAGFAIDRGPLFSDHSHAWDERRAYVGMTRTWNPMEAEQFMRVRLIAPPWLQARQLTDKPLLIIDPNRGIPLDPQLDAPGGSIVGFLGVAGATLPLDGICADMYGLASQLGARVTITDAGAIGHEKPLPTAWQVAQFADPEFDSTYLPSFRQLVVAARHALSCGEIAELLDAARAPLTASRFFANLTGSIGRTRLEIPADPLEAERAFCR